MPFAIVFQRLPLKAGQPLHELANLAAKFLSLKPAII